MVKQNCDETHLPTDSMAADDTSDAAPNGSPAAAGVANTEPSTGKPNDHRGKRGGRDRGNDKSTKRKHAGFGSAR